MTTPSTYAQQLDTIKRPIRLDLKLENGHWKLSQSPDWANVFDPLQDWYRLKTPEKRLHYFLVSLVKAAASTPKLRHRCNATWLRGYAGLMEAGFVAVTPDGNIATPQVSDLATTLSPTPYPAEFVVDFWGLFTQSQLAYWIAKSGNPMPKEEVKLYEPSGNYSYYEYWHAEWPRRQVPLEAVRVATKQRVDTDALGSFFGIFNLYHAVQPSRLNILYEPNYFFFNTNYDVYTLSGERLIALVNGATPDLEVDNIYFHKL